MDTLTTFLAVWGAIVATGTAAYTIWRDYRKGRRLIVTPWFNSATGELVFNLENVGGERVVVQFIGGETENGAQFVLQHAGGAIPITLEPGDVQQLTFEPGPLLPLKDMRRIRRLFARTAGGKCWFAAKQDAEQAVQELLSLLAHAAAPACPAR